jgi:molecular chaperone Hsp33
MNDEIVIAETGDGLVRIHAACTTAMVEEARKTHDCLATSAAALGRTLTVTAVMASDLKSDQERITSIFNGHGPAGTVLAQANGKGDVKGYISDPHIYLTRSDGHLDVGRAIGTDGNLTVTRDMGMSQPFTGVVKIQTGEVGQDFAYYYAVSEQTRSVVSVGVLVEPEGNVSAAGGLILQLLPDAGEETVERVEEVAKKLKPMTDLIREGKDMETIIHMYFPDAVILDHRPVRYYCGCSREHYHDALKVLKVSDLQEMIADDAPAEITCAYCEKKYIFPVDELKEILAEKCGGSVQ